MNIQIKEFEGIKIKSIILKVNSDKKAEDLQKKVKVIMFLMKRYSFEIFLEAHAGLVNDDFVKGKFTLKLTFI